MAKQQPLLLLALLSLFFLAIQQISARVFDDCMDTRYVHDHSPDMAVDYRQANPNYLNDTNRFKRDDEGGLNQNPDANQFWVIYKSLTGFTNLKTRIFWWNGGNTPASQDRKFFISTDNIIKEELTLGQFSETGDIDTANGYFYRDYNFPLNNTSTYFFEIRFADWFLVGGIVNDWTPQIGWVDYDEVGDASCGQGGLCNATDSLNRTQKNCETCPQDCGVCDPVCGDGICELGESWAPSTGLDTSDLGPLTCPGDCDNITTPGNGKCDPGEVCRSNNTHSSSDDCCPPGNFTFNNGFCGDGECDGYETCSSCPADCGVCPRCFDGICNGDETCLSCYDDCCAPPGTGFVSTTAQPAVTTATKHSQTTGAKHETTASSSKSTTGKIVGSSASASIAAATTAKSSDSGASNNGEAFVSSARGGIAGSALALILAAVASVVLC